jgi:hypothetical protein
MSDDATLLDVLLWMAQETSADENVFDEWDVDRRAYVANPRARTIGCV